MPTGLYVDEAGTVTNPRIKMEFDFLSNGSRQGWYKYLSFDVGAIVTSQSWQDNLGVETVFAPASMRDIPTRESDAVVKTTEGADATWATPTHTVDLFLAGVHTAQWQVTFPVAMFPFRLDGTWTLQ